jgi:hypothetical protein
MNQEPSFLLQKTLLFLLFYVIFSYLSHNEAIFHEDRRKIIYENLMDGLLTIVLLGIMLYLAQFRNFS